MIEVLGLIEIHPFDGSDSLVAMRLSRKVDGYLFDLPVSGEQVELLLANLAPKHSEPEPQTQVSPPNVGGIVTEDDDIRLASSYYQEDDDDDL